MFDRQAHGATVQREIGWRDMFSFHRVNDAADRTKLSARRFYCSDKRAELDMQHHTAQMGARCVEVKLGLGLS